MKRKEGDVGSGFSRLRILAVYAVLFSVAEALDRGYWACRRLLERGAKTGVFEIYVVGESTAVGEPYGEKLAPASLVAQQFEDHIGSRGIRIITVAARGHSIYPQSVALERQLSSRDGRNPGVTLVYSGHNDTGGRHDPPPAYERFRRAATARSTLLRDLWYLVENYFPLLRLRSMESWDYHLRRVVEMSFRKGLTPILATVVSNTADIDPGLSIDNVKQDEARSVLEHGMLLETQKRYGEALRHYEAESASHPALRRYLKYRIARCHQALAHYDLARRFYRELVDSGDAGNFGRASGEQNEMIRALAGEYGVPLADAERIFEAHSPHALPGNTLFSDGHHPNIEGYRLLAAAYAQEISTTFGEPIRRPLTDEADCIRRTSLSRRDQAKALLASGRWLFSVAARHAYPRQRLEMARELFQRAQRLDPDDFSAWMGMQMVALAERSRILSDQEGLDWLGRHDLFYGRDYSLSCDLLSDIVKKYDQATDGVDLHRRCLAEAGRNGSTPRPLLDDRLSAIMGGDKDHVHALLDRYRRLGKSQMSAWLVARLTSGSSGHEHESELLLNSAEATLQDGELELTVELIKRTLSLDLEPEDLGRVALLYQGLKDYPKALGILDRLVRRQPRCARWRSDRGVVRFLSGRKNDAAEDWIKAIDLDPRFEQAYQSLGMFYAMSGRRQEALEVYNKALKQAPAPIDGTTRHRIQEARDGLLIR
ncbi:MAG: hypothetical protein A2X40_11235 [Elusimicrobia bacterium GWC2_65_9]|nr:MAG: hypothetical protein A2X37_01960 [Elusimicrobia bacterium GWA2_66_18]OGR77425.1 MAG: hypothetical protein A2X40_11235 [Elusimicrobia bacterium GWC2_65_9]